MRMKRIWFAVMIMLCGGILLTGCDDDGGGGTETVELSGTVAAGAPLADAVVSVVNSNGDVAGPEEANADGTYAVSVKKEGPYLLMADCPSCDTPLYSYASGEGTVNITPLTHLALFVAAGLDTHMADLYDTWGDTSISPSDVAQSTRIVNANLEEVYTEFHVDASTYNFYNTCFKADHTGIDAVLDTLDITVDANGAAIDAAVSIKTDEGSDILFDQYKDISEYHLVDRVPPEDAKKMLSDDNALLVCSYDDAKCQSIMIENAYSKSELEQQAASLPKDQKIIFY